MCTSLDAAIGYLDINKHGSILPYIQISSPFGRPLKFLVDTGASSSFIDPKFVHPDDVTRTQPITIATILNKHNIDKKVTLPKFVEFKQPGEIQFLVFRFHGYFDGLLGLDALTAIGAKIDLAKQTLVTGNTNIPIYFKPNFMSGKYIVPPKSKIVARLPVDIKNGDIYIKPLSIKHMLIIPEGIYKAKDWYSLIEVTNQADYDQNFILEQPLKVTPFSSKQFIEANNFNVQYDNSDITSTRIPDDITKLIRTSHLNTEERKHITKLCREYDDIFLKEGQKLSFTNVIKHTIPTDNDLPIYTKSYRYPFIHKQEVQRQIKDMLEQGIIRPSYSPWSSPVWIVPKKMDASGKQKWRLVIDYRRLNEKTVTDRYPLPNINEILDKLGRCMYFSTLDLASGYHQIEMNPSDIKKTAFTVEGGHFEYVRMPFGLKNAPSTFQRVMDNVLKEYQGKICLVYLDDIIIFSTSLQEHLENTKKVFQRLRESNLKVQIDKSEFLHKEIAFLGHIVTTEGVKPNPDKVKAIREFPIPRSRKEIKSFLGLLGYYRKFIKDFAKLTKPMTECLKKDKKIVLDDRYIQTFNICKELLINDPILQYPDFSKPFNLTTDASNYAIGAILSQGPIGSDKPVCYASRTLTDSEVNYSTIEKELLAIVWATKYFRPYLFGHKFKIITDHKPLTWLMNLKDPNTKLVRWRLKLEEYDYEITYKKGKSNTNADALSRIRPQEINLNEVDNHSIQGTSGTTIHSATEDLNDGIPISERPLNEFNLQLILENSDRQPSNLLSIIFRNKQRRTIRNPNFSEDNIIDIFKQYTPPNKVTAIFTTDDNIFRTVQNVYSKYFARCKTFKVIRCTELLDDILNEDDQDKTIREYHEKNNHRGINETLAHLKRIYYFPFMKNKICKVLNNCIKCQTLKYNRNPPKLQFQIPENPEKPLDIIHIDIYSINNRKILTIIDKFSKFAAAYTLPARNSLHVIKSLKCFMSLHGIPQKIITDQGAEFLSTIFQDFCKQYDVQLHTTSFQQSSSNAPVERLHSTLTEIYRIIFDKRKTRDHEEILNETLITYNNAVHSATNLTPYELFYGRTYKFKNLNYRNVHEYLDRLHEFQNKLFPEVRNYVEQHVTKNIDKLNKKRETPFTVKEGSIAYRKENRRNKLTPRFSRHKIKRNGRVTVITYRDQKVHKSKLKKKRKFQGTDDANIRTETGDTSTRQ